ncbi:L-threonylcarbamoyladenylate synthase [Croceicoccus marinus]|uniref:Threonylcarbamoyl-AMP synthase n=1 Tax=Croceicoccus marinus TaxID=450378 RepID=A0A1Z1FDV0_9SPHN|nr:L-threonylcarbamoyladenylate synthase [Croceicoccus marinus]ARU16999.1 threonylcarbamoyl-AMP synthase [Croceicoccus marinus]
MSAANADPAGPEILPMGEGALQRAASALEAGQPVAVPTETVYGLAARADSDAAVAAIYAAKGRPSFNPLIVHVPDSDAARRLAGFDRRAADLASRFWPGPLTMVLPRLPGAPLADAVTAGLPTVALRCPAHPAMQALLRRCAFPLAAPSANRSGAISPSTAQHVARSLNGRIGLVIDAGAAQQGIESTIVALDAGGWRILRPGPVTADQLREVLGTDPDTRPTGGAIEAPGQLDSHYAPGKPVRLNAAQARGDEYHIGFADIAGDTSLSPGGDLFEAAARLYACLHRAAESAQPRIAVAPIPKAGIGAAINDRLARAAA